MNNSQIIILIGFLITAQAALEEINKQTFSTLFNMNFQHFSDSFSALNRDYFILFYLPEVEQSLEARALINQIADQYERKYVEMLKKRGVTQYQEFEKHLQQTLQLTSVDCGQNSKICQYFNIGTYPVLLYLTKNRKTYLYKGWFNDQQILSFIFRSNNNGLDLRFLQEHTIQTSLFGQVKSLLKNQFVMYAIIFLLLPFIFGYFVMAKPNNAQDNSPNKQSKQSKKINSLLKNKVISQKGSQHKKKD